MKTISIIGTGNVATHLYKALSGKSGIDVRIINSRSLEDLPEMSDLIIISVKDDAIEDVANKLKGKGVIIAHTSGSVNIEALRGCGKQTGVFYPLQTFTKDKELTYEDIPFFIEGSDEETEKALEEYARLISRNVTLADSEKRKILHISAVFACNFSNHLVTIADQLLHEHGMDYRILLPLLKETIKKLEILPPADAQTGPAIRCDKKIMESHERMLTHHPEMLQIYKLISQSIMEERTKSQI